MTFTSHHNPLAAVTPDRRQADRRVAKLALAIERPLMDRRKRERRFAAADRHYADVLAEVKR
jgi:hypothetical protein